MAILNVLGKLLIVITVGINLGIWLHLMWGVLFNLRAINYRHSAVFACLVVFIEYDQIFTQAFVIIWWILLVHLIYLLIEVEKYQK
jgi:hypothetical protein